MIHLHELAIGVNALLGGQHEVVAVLAGQAGQIVEVGFGPARPLAVGAARDFQLQEPHFDAHLQHFAAVVGPHDAR